MNPDPTKVPALFQELQCGFEFATAPGLLDFRLSQAAKLWRDDFSSSKIFIYLEQPGNQSLWGLHVTAHGGCLQPAIPFKCQPHPN
jgi:hypothetical protein